MEYNQEFLKEGDLLTALKRFFAPKKQELDMTEGSIAGNIIKFALPLLAGNLFQQLYNMVDTWVIGQTGDNAAFAAVGSVAPAINILIGFFMGLSSGAGVVISQYYGAKKEDKVHDAVHTSVMMTLILGVVFTIVGVAMTPYVLKLMLHSDGGSETSVFAYAKSYLTIYFSGMIGLMVYNICSGIMRAVGDSQRPFYFLVISSVINIVLDWVFVMWFDMSVVGVALATVIAQLTSAFLSFFTLIRTQSCVRVLLRDLKIDFGILAKVVKVGIPAGLQMALTSFSNLFVQSYIANVNLGGDFSPETMKEISLSSWTAYSKVDQLIFLPVQSIALSITTFVAQNLGMRNVERAKKGVNIGFLMGACANISLIVIVMIGAPVFARIFNDDPDVVKYATILFHYITPFYFFTCINQVYSAALRGAGNSRAPMVIMLCTFVGFRQIYLFIVSSYISNGLLPIALGYPAGWVTCALTTIIYYKFIFKMSKSRIIEVG